MFIKYNDFKLSMNENVAQAKTFMKNRALAIKREKAKKANPEVNEKEVGLSPAEQKAAENDADFLKIKNMLSKNDGWTYLFTKLHFDTTVPEDSRASLEDLETLYRDLLELKPILNRLPMELLRYASIKPSDEDGRYPFEKLSDDLDGLKGDRVTNKFINELLPFQKQQYEAAGEVQKEKISGIAKAFTELGDDSKSNAALQKMFFSKLKADKSLQDVINRAVNFIKSANNSQMSKFLQAIQTVNDKYGEMNGAQIVYDEKGILIIEVKSYQANAALNGNTAHCIARYQGHWDSYTGDNTLNKQYYVYNFNLTPDNNKSVIGITIDEGGGIRACHTKNDGTFSSEMKAYMKSIDVPFSVLAPMTREEVVAKKKRIEANKKIINSGLTAEQAAQYIEDGADPNAKAGVPLQNAVKEDNYEKTEILIKKGAHPNIGGCIKGAKNLKMIKLLVDNGSDITNDVFTSIVKDYEAVEYVLKAGVDPNFEQGMPLRSAAKLITDNPIKTMDLLIKYGARISERRYMVVKWACEFGRPDILEFLLNKMKAKGDDKLNDSNKKEWFTEMASWTNSSDKIDHKKKDEMIDWIEKYSGIKFSADMRKYPN